MNVQKVYNVFHDLLDTCEFYFKKSIVIPHLHCACIISFIVYLFRHYGDMGNIWVHTAKAEYDQSDDYVELFGEYKVIGRSFVVCAKSMIIFILQRICEILSILAKAVADLYSKILDAPLIKYILHIHAVFRTI